MKSDAEIAAAAVKGTDAIKHKLDELGRVGLRLVQIVAQTARFLPSRPDQRHEGFLPRIRQDAVRYPRLTNGIGRLGFDDFKRQGRQRADQVADLASLSVLFGGRGLEEGIGHQVAFQLRRRFRGVAAQDEG